MEKVSALLSFLYPFPSQHHFCSHTCYPLWSSSPSHALPIRTEVTYVDKLQTWEFKLETVRLLSGLTSPFHEQCGPRMWEWMSPFSLYTPRQTCASFGWEGQGFFPQLPFNSLGQVFLFLVATLFLCR